MIKHELLICYNVQTCNIVIYDSCSAGALRLLIDLVFYQPAKYMYSIACTIIDNCVTASLLLKLTWLLYSLNIYYTASAS